MPLRPDCTSGHLFALADSARCSKRRRKSGEIRHRLLTIGSDQQAASKHRQWPDDRFHQERPRRLAVRALLLLVQGSDAAHVTKLLARSAGSPLPASAVTTARAHKSRRRDARWPIFVVGLVLIGIGIAIRQWVVALVGQFLTIDARVHSGQTVVEKRLCRWGAHGAARAPAWAPEAASNAKSPG